MKFRLAIGLLVLSAQISAADYSSNLKIMIDAAQTLEFPSSDNKPYLLVKRETVRAPIAVIFGYHNNEIACEELASTLSLSGSVGTFLCDAVY